MEIYLCLFSAGVSEPPTSPIGRPLPGLACDSFSTVARRALWSDDTPIALRRIVVDRAALPPKGFRTFAYDRLGANTTGVRDEKRTATVIGGDR